MGRFFHHAIYPLFILCFVVPIFMVYDTLSVTELQQLSLILIIGSMLTAFALEIFLPFDRRFKMFTKQFIWDSYFTFIQLPIISIIIDLLGNFLKSKRVPTLGFLWPHQWNAIAQTFAILVIAELFYYTYHYLGHKSDFMWRIHKYHHRLCHLVC